MIHTELGADIVLLTLETIRNLTTSRNAHRRTIHQLGFSLILLTANDDVTHTSCIQIQNQGLPLKVQLLIILQLHTSTLNLHRLLVAGQTLCCSLNLCTLLREISQALFRSQIKNGCGINNDSIGTERLTVSVQPNITVLILEVLIVSNGMNEILYLCERLSVNDTEIHRIEPILHQFLTIIVDRTRLSIQIQNTERTTFRSLHVAELHSKSRLTSSLLAIHKHTKLLTNSRCITNNSHICKFLSKSFIKLSSTHTTDHPFQLHEQYNPTDE